jgi:hypothetical protein
MCQIPGHYKQICLLYGCKISIQNKYFTYESTVFPGAMNSLVTNAQNSIHYECLMQETSEYPLNNDPFIYKLPNLRQYK